MKLEADVRPMAPDETVQAALLHTRELPHEFLTRFGSEFLSRYYRAFIESPHAVALVAGVDGEPERSGGERVDGALLGTFDTGAHYSYLVRRHGPGLALSGLRQVCRRPRLAGELVRTRLLRYLRGILRSFGYAAAGGKNDASDREEERIGFVAYVAVDRKRRGRGIGPALRGLRGAGARGRAAASGAGHATRRARRRALLRAHGLETRGRGHQPQRRALRLLLQRPRRRVHRSRTGVDGVEPASPGFE